MPSPTTARSSVRRSTIGRISATPQDNSFHGAGVFLASGTVTNGATNGSAALIQSDNIGVDISGGGTVTNDGRITGYGTATIYRDFQNLIFSKASGSGVLLGLGGTVFNGVASAVIRGGAYGVRIGGAAGSVANAGTIAGYGAYYNKYNTPTRSVVGVGVALLAGGSVLNELGGVIHGGVVGVSISGTPTVASTPLATVTNYGTITAETGVQFGAGLTQATFINGGTVVGTTGSALRFLSGNDTVVLQQGGVFQGGVIASATGSNTLVLGADSAPQAIGGLGVKYRNFGTVAEQAGAQWNVAGTNAATARLAVSLASGAVLAVQGSLAVTGGAYPGSLTLSGAGTLGVGPGGAIAVGTGAALTAGAITVQDATFSATGTIAAAVVDNGLVTTQGNQFTFGTPLVFGQSLAGSGVLSVGNLGIVEAKAGLSVADVSFDTLGRLLLDQPGLVTSTFENFSDGNAIDLVGRAVTAIAFDSGTDRLTVSAGAATVATLQFSGSYAANNFSFRSDGLSGTEILSNA